MANTEPDPVGDALAQIAREELGIETLEVRGRDRLDFHDVGVAGLRRALERAYELGVAKHGDPRAG
jgi:NCAIR mutase (PurE)-related protein